MGGRESLCFYRYDGFLCFYLLPFPFLFPLSVLKGSQPSLEGLETSLNPVWSPEVLKSFSCLPKNPSINYLVSFPLFSLSFSPLFFFFVSFALGLLEYARVPLLFNCFPQFVPFFSPLGTQILGPFEKIQNQNFRNYSTKPLREKVSDRPPIQHIFLDIEYIFEYLLSCTLDSVSHCLILFSTGGMLETSPWPHLLGWPQWNAALPWIRSSNAPAMENSGNSNWNIETKPWSFQHLFSSTSWCLLRILCKQHS